MNLRATVALSVMLCLLAGLGSAPAVASQRTDDGFGDRRVGAAAYDWLGYRQPSDMYSITLVTGRTERAVLRVLEARKELGPMTYDEAGNWFWDRLDPQTYTGPHVVQVEARGPGVVVIDVAGFPTDQSLERLSRRGTASSFSTNGELDTYLTVARRGRVVRQFDTMFRPPRAGALPAERGLGFGRKGVDPFSPSWALNERLTRIHVSEEWFGAPHPTYVLPGTAY